MVIPSGRIFDPTSKDCIWKPQWNQRSGAKRSKIKAVHTRTPCFLSGNSLKREKKTQPANLISYLHNLFSAFTAVMNRWDFSPQISIFSEATYSV